jgi:hypothetical protein
MARALLEIQRDCGEVRLLLDSGEPVPNHAIELMFKNVCHSLKSARTAILATYLRRAVYRIVHNTLRIAQHSEFSR